MRILINSLIVMCLILSSCSSDPYTFRVPVDPTAANLSKPANNSQCLEVEKVKFEWNKSENTESYTITIINLLSNEVTTQNSSTNTLEVTLPKGQPYSWQITSKNSGSSKIAKSEVWKFYLSGEAQFNHAPFPAEIISPKNDAKVNTGSIKLSWTVSDVDTGDTHKFDIKLDKVDGTTLISTDQSATEKNEDLSAGTYFWQVIAKDDKGNHSDSGIYKFIVK